MSLISLRCPNCAGSIELDEKKDFGFCMHCGQRVILSENIAQTVRIDHSHSIKNWKKLAEVARESNNVDDLKKYVEKILEVDSEHAEGWILKGCASAIEGNIDEAAIHWRTGISLTKTSSELETHFMFIAHDLSISMIGHAIRSFDDLDVISIFVTMFEKMPVELENADCLLLEPIIDSLASVLFEDMDAAVFYDIYVITYDMMILSLASEFSCKILLKKANEYRNLVDKCCKKSKALKVIVPDSPGELYYKKSTIVFRLETDASMMSMFASMCHNYLHDISEEKNNTLKEQWERNTEDPEMFILFYEGVTEYKEGVSSLFGKKQIISGQRKIELYLKKFTSIV